MDTELQVVHGIEKHSFGNWKEGAATLEIWRGTQPLFVPVTEACWFSELALNHCGRWMAEHPAGIVWVDHTEFGQMLSKRYRTAFYAEGGRNQFGQFIEDHPPGTPFIASMQSNKKGHNLQSWHDMLLTVPPYTGGDLEQLIGREHRQGQKAETVTVDLLINCWEAVNTFWKSVRDCEYTEGTTTIPQKVSIATIDIPDLEDIEEKRGHRWVRSKS